jgi:hypothetical protein
MASGNKIFPVKNIHQKIANARIDITLLSHFQLSELHTSLRRAEKRQANTPTSQRHQTTVIDKSLTIMPGVLATKIVHSQEH